MNDANFAILMKKVIGAFLLIFSINVYPAAVFGDPGPDTSYRSGSDEFNPFEENGKVGLKNKKGDILIPARYDALGWSDGKFSIVENVTGYRIRDQWGLINLTNHQITSAEFIEVSPSESSLIIVRKKIPNSVRMPAGAIAPSGKVIIPFAYDGIRICGLRAIVFEKSGMIYRHGLIDFQNRALIPLRYERIYPLGTLRFAVESFENKTAIFSEQGQQLTGFVIDSLSAFQKNYAVLYQDNNQGVINRDGLILIQPEYLSVRIDENGNIFTRKGNNWQFLDGENRQTRVVSADSIVSLSPSLYKMKYAAGYRLVNRELKPVSGLLFSYIGKFQNGKAIFAMSNKKGVIGNNGRVVVDARYSQIIPEGNFIRASERSGNSEKWLLLDSTGKILTQKKYDYLGNFNGKFFPALHKNHWGAVDENGKEAIACVHDSVVQFLNDHVVVKFKGQYGIITTDEKWVVTPQKNRIRMAGKELFIEYAKENRFLKNFKGEIIYFTPNRMEAADSHLVEYLSGGEILKVSFKGQISERSFPGKNTEHFVTSPQEGFRIIKKDGKFGFVDDQGRLRIANRYDDVQNFNEGLAAAKLLGKWGYISKDDKIAIQPAYDEVFAFNNGMAIIRIGSLFGLIDVEGKVMLPARYDQIKKLSSGRFMVSQNNSLGLADARGKMILNPKFEKIQDLNNGYFIVSRDGKSGVISLDGLSTIPMVYDAITFDPFHNEFLALQSHGWEQVKF